MKPSNTNQPCIVILGMHRSGTSAITGVLNLLGVDLGSDLYPASPHNPRGYWEHRQIMETHEQVFEILGRPWYCNWAPLPEKWWQDKAFTAARERLIDIVKRDFSDSSIWGVKDPRLCVLLPLWYSVFEALECSPCFVHIVRNPAEVANSLADRDHFPKEVSLLLWLRYVLESEKETRSYPRLFVTFDQFLEDWRLSVDRISQVFELDWPKNVSLAADDIERFLSPELKHHNVGHDLTRLESPLSHLIEACYRGLLSAAKGDDAELIGVLSMISEEWQTGLRSPFSQMFERVSHIQTIRAYDCDLMLNRTRRLVQERKTDLDHTRSQLQKKSAELDRARSQLLEKSTELDRTRSELQEKSAELGKILTSRSWRLTAPLRRAFNLATGSLKT